MTARRSVTVGIVAACVAGGLFGGATGGLNAKAKQTGRVGAGGRAVAHHAGAQRVAAERVPEALMFRLGVPAAEPTLGITHTGRVIYAAGRFGTIAGGAGITPDVMASDDGGRTWKMINPTVVADQRRHPVSMDPYVYVDRLPDGDTSRIFNIDLTVACSLLSFTDDGGESWFTNPLACGRPINDHQTLFSGPPVTSPTFDYPHIVYYCWNDVASTSCGKSLDGGVTWHSSGTPAFVGVDVTQEQAVCGGINGHGVVGRHGGVYVPREYCGQAWLGISHDEGLTWRTEQVATKGFNGRLAGASHPAVDVDSKGNIYYAWIARDRLPYLAVSTDDGETWGRPMMIGAPGVTEANMTSIDVGDPGKIAIAYMGTENAKGPIDERDYQEVTWNGYVTMATDALDRNPVFYSGPVNDTDDPFVKGRCGPGRCQAVWDFIDIEIGLDGQPYAAFVDGCPGGELFCEPYIGEGILGRLVGGPPLR